MLLVLVSLIAIHGRPRASTPSQGPEIAGCYRADRALGTSANSAFGRGVPGPVGRRIGEDSASLPALQAFRLRDGARVERPGTAMRESWTRASRWALAGDTIRVTLSTGLSGWDLTLGRVGDGEYTGTARYLTDVVVKDGSGPLVVPVRVRREPCAPAPGDRHG